MKIEVAFEWDGDILSASEKERVEEIFRDDMNGQSHELNSNSVIVQIFGNLLALNGVVLNEKRVPIFLFTLSLLGKYPAQYTRPK